MMKALGLAMVMLMAAGSALAADTAVPVAQPVKELKLDLGNGVSLKLVQISAGKFTMGSPETEKDRYKNETQHEVTISKSFYMGVTEVTQEQYEAVMGNNPSKYKGKTNPVETVRWDDAVAFCKKLSQKTGKTVQLPTEAQWEYACRAGNRIRFSFGDKEEDLHKHGNYCDKSNTDGSDWQDKEHGDGFDKTAPVGSLKPNAWGLYDMHGNVWEWCQDWYAEYPAGAVTDPTREVNSGLRVVRGGSWYNNPPNCRSAYRRRVNAVDRNDASGFRVVVLAAGVD